MRADGVNMNGGSGQAAIVRVVAIRQDSPAGRVRDLHVGDRVLSIDGVSLASMPFTDVVYVFHKHVCLNLSIKKDLRR